MKVVFLIISHSLLFFLEFMSFLELQLPEQKFMKPVVVLDSEDKNGEMNITLPNVTVGPGAVHTAYVSGKNVCKSH